MANPKCIVILSTKSAGSSACQRFLQHAVGARHVDRTRHFENETLYWTKAASVLGLAQQPMLGSEVPIPAARARQDLHTLLGDNLPGHTPPTGDEALIFDGWRDLCRHYGPVFLEKSPHHLFQWSALELLLQAMQRLPEVDFLLIGLVRNPMDNLYSAFQRWKLPPERLQYEWLQSYQNLQKLRERVGPRLLTLRYEDMVDADDWLRPVEAFCERPRRLAGRGELHRRSLQKWKQDPLYGFVLAEEVAALAERYGYARAELANEPKRLWPIYRTWAQTLHQGWQPARGVVRGLRNRLFPARAH